MYAFSNQHELYGVLQSLFKEVEKQPTLIRDFVHSNLVVRISLVNPNAEVLLDGRQPPLGVFFGSRPGEANFEISLESELLHSIWMSQQSLVETLFSGKIQTKGNVMRAQPFLDLLSGCAPLYQNLRAADDKVRDD